MSKVVTVVLIIIISVPLCTFRATNHHSGHCKAYSGNNSSPANQFDAYLNYIRILAPVEALALLEEVKLLGIKLTPGLNDYYAGTDRDEKIFSEYE